MQVINCAFLKTSLLKTINGNPAKIMPSADKHTSQLQGNSTFICGVVNFLFYLLKKYIHSRKRICLYLISWHSNVAHTCKYTHKHNLLTFLIVKEKHLLWKNKCILKYKMLLNLFGKMKTFLPFFFQKYSCTMKKINHKQWLVLIKMMSSSWPIMSCICLNWFEPFRQHCHFTINKAEIQSVWHCFENVVFRLLTLFGLTLSLCTSGYKRCHRLHEENKYFM